MTIPIEKKDHALHRVLHRGEPLISVAKEMGISVPTLSRWKKEYIEAQTVEVLEPENEEMRDRLDRLDHLKTAKEEVYTYFEKLGKNFLLKTIRRLQDLPDEAISPNLVPQYANMALQLIRVAHEGWAEEVKLAELMQSIRGEVDERKTPKKIVRVIVDPQQLSLFENGTTD